MLGWFITQKQITETEIGIWEEGAAIIKTEDICNRGRAGAQTLLRDCYRQTLSARSICSLSFQVLRRLWREGEGCFGALPDLFPSREARQGAFGACVKERASLGSLIYCF